MDTHTMKIKEPAAPHRLQTSCRNPNQDRG